MRELTSLSGLTLPSDGLAFGARLAPVRALDVLARPVDGRREQCVHIVGFAVAEISFVPKQNAGLAAQTAEPHQRAAYGLYIVQTCLHDKLDPPDWSSAPQGHHVAAEVVSSLVASHRAE